jgi:hypothetical protein
MGLCAARGVPPLADGCCDDPLPAAAMDEGADAPGVAPSECEAVTAAIEPMGMLGFEAALEVDGRGPGVSQR